MVPNRLLKQARELRGWSQAKVAKEIGTDATTVSRWERGLFFPTPYFRERLCVLFSKDTEELGLLESVDRLGECERAESACQQLPSLSTGQWPREWCREEYLANSVDLLPPSWSESTDTFSYILHSAAHDQQAHMLWKDAYVQALQGHCAEAQQLGEASLRAFECIGHVNAQAVREWLSQEVFAPASPLATNLATVPLSPKRRAPSPKEFLHERSARIALLLIGSFWLLFALDLPIIVR